MGPLPWILLHYRLGKCKKQSFSIRIFCALHFHHPLLRWNFLGRLQVISKLNTTVIFPWLKAVSLYRSRSRVQGHTNNADASNNKGRTGSDWRLTKMILAIFLSFIICYLPATIIKSKDKNVKHPGKTIYTIFLIHLTFKLIHITVKIGTWWATYWFIYRPVLTPSSMWRWIDSIDRLTWAFFSHGGPTRTLS